MKIVVTPNEGPNNLHSGPNCYHTRFWTVLSHTENAITLELISPAGDQGFPGKATIQVTYRLDNCGGLHIVYDAVSDRDTVFNLTNHSYFNLAGQEKVDAAMEQLLTLPARFFNPCDGESIPTGELRRVEGTPMDFRSPKPIGRDIDMDYEPLKLQGGYDHNFEVFCNPCAYLQDPSSGRSMAFMDSQVCRAAVSNSVLPAFCSSRHLMWADSLSAPFTKGSSSLSSSST